MNWWIYIGISAIASRLILFFIIRWRRWYLDPRYPEVADFPATDLRVDFAFSAFMSLIWVISLPVCAVCFRVWRSPPSAVPLPPPDSTPLSRFLRVKITQPWDYDRVTR